MEAPLHTLNELFKQLGLEDSNDAIHRFIKQHKPLPASTRLCKAPFWNPAQSSFLKEAIDEDADWAELIDQLDAMLR